MQLRVDVLTAGARRLVYCPITRLGPSRVVLDSGEQRMRSKRGEGQHAGMGAAINFPINFDGKHGRYM